MKRMWVAVLAAVAVVMPAGCGTICNFAHGDPDIYGGVQRDIEILQAPLFANSGSSLHLSGGVQTAAIVAAICGGDVIVSFIADTLTLPLAIFMRHEDHSGDETGSPGKSDPANAANPATQGVSSETTRAGDRTYTTK